MQAEGLARNEVSQRESSSGSEHVNLIVLLVEFSDVKHTTSKNDIHSLIFHQMANYYKEVSYGMMVVAGNVTDWATLNHPMNYYGQESKDATDVHSKNLIVDAVKAFENTQLHEQDGLNRDWMLKEIWFL